MVRCGKQIETLKDHADIGAALQNILLLELVERVALLAIADQITIDGDEAAIDTLQVADGAQERRLDGAGRAENGGHAAGEG